MWLSYVVNLEQQLELALDKFIDCNLQSSRQNCQENSESENKEAGDKSEVVVLTSK